MKGFLPPPLFIFILENAALCSPWISASENQIVQDTTYLQTLNSDLLQSSTIRWKFLYNSELH